MTIDKPAIDGILCVTLLIFDQIRKKDNKQRWRLNLKADFLNDLKKNMLARLIRNKRHELTTRVDQRISIKLYDTMYVVLCVCACLCAYRRC